MSARGASQRVTAFLAQRAKLRGLDPDHIIAAHYATLYASDLRALLDATPGDPTGTLAKVRADAWDEGWRAAQQGAYTKRLNDGDNPYRAEAATP